MDRRDSAFFSANRLYPDALRNSPLPQPVKMILILCVVGCVILLILGVVAGLRPDLLPMFGPEKKENKKD